MALGNHRVQVRADFVGKYPKGQVIRVWQYIERGEESTEIVKEKTSSKEKMIHDICQQTKCPNL